MIGMALFIADGAADGLAASRWPRHPRTPMTARWLFAAGLGEGVVLGLAAAVGIVAVRGGRVPGWSVVPSSAAACGARARCW